MGYNTTLLLHNDSFGSKIFDRPTFGRDLILAIEYAHYNQSQGGRGILDIPRTTESVGYLIRQSHADTTHIIAAGGNYATVLRDECRRSHHTDADKLEIIKALANDIGYKLVKKAN